MKKVKLSKFDLGFVIAFGVLTALGFGAYYYLSTQLDAAKLAALTAHTEFDKNSINAKYKFVVTSSNAKQLQENADLLKNEINPVIQDKFMAKESKLQSAKNQDTVAWKHDLDDTVHQLATEAKAHNVTIPNNFYFSFGRYLKENPSDEQTGVLGKQLFGVKEIASILIKAPVKSIKAFRRSYEEDSNPGAPAGGDNDKVNGRALSDPGKLYTVYPFELEFQATSDSLRSVVNGLMKSPYVFTIRTISIVNTTGTSPKLSELEKMAGPPPPPAPSVTDSAPGEVAAAPPAKGPQYLFGNSVLTVKMKIDMVEWTGGLIVDKPGDPKKK